MQCFLDNLSRFTIATNNPAFVYVLIFLLQFAALEIGKPCGNVSISNINAIIINVGIADIYSGRGAGGGGGGGGYTGIAIPIIDTHSHVTCPVHS